MQQVFKAEPHSSSDGRRPGGGAGASRLLDGARWEGGFCAACRPGWDGTDEMGCPQRAAGLGGVDDPPPSVSAPCLLFPGRRLCLTCVSAVGDTWPCPGDALALQLLVLKSQSDGATLVPATARSYHCLEPSWSHMLQGAS